jgi:hypothetical protein
MQKQTLQNYLITAFSNLIEISSDKKLEEKIRMAEVATINNNELLCYLIFRIQELSDYEFEFEQCFKNQIEYLEQTYALNIRSLRVYLDSIFE